MILNLAGRIGDHLDGSPCQVFAEGMKVQLADEGILYPAASGALSLRSIDLTLPFDRLFKGVAAA